jgi:glycosyltransferase involved in cell wall biosynthesis
MKICFLLQDTGNLYGAERATLDLAEGLSRRPGVSVKVVLIEETRLHIRQNRLRETLQQKGLAIDRIPMSGRFSWAAVKAIRARLLEQPVSLLHAAGYKATVLGGLAAGWGRHAPAVSTVHGWLFRADFKERFYGWTETLALRRYPRVIALSHFYENMLKTLGVPERRLVRIPSGLPAADVPEAGRAAELWGACRPFTFGMMGRFSSEKNHAMFLKAARAVVNQHPEARFLIVGSGGEEASIRRAIQRMNLEPAVELAGFEERESFFSRAHALVICSTIENLPYSALEAMAWCRPLLVTAAGGLPEVVQDGQNGYLVPLDDAERLATRMLDCLRHPARARKLGEAGRHSLEQKYMLDRVVADHYALYQSLL